MGTAMSSRPVVASPGGDTEALHHLVLLRQILLHLLAHVENRTVPTENDTRFKNYVEVRTCLSTT